MHSSTQTPFSNVARTDSRPRVGSSLLRGIRYAILFDLFLAAFVVSAAYLVGWMAFHVPTAIVILGGLVLIGLAVVRGASPS